MFSLLFLIIVSGLFAVTSLSLCTAHFHNTLIVPCSYTGLGMCVCTICLSFQCQELCILSNETVHAHVSLFFIRMEQPEVRWSFKLFT